LELNVRSGPGTSYPSLGLIPGSQAVQVVSKSSDGSWLQILYPLAPAGSGWVDAQYVTLGSGAVPTITPRASPTASGPTGTVTIQLNVRSGPATTFSSLGMLQAGTVVSLRGKDSLASWFQIDYLSGPGGRGWVTAEYIQTDDASILPVLDEYGTPVVTGTAGPTPPPMTPTTTIGPAPDNGDSQQQPVVQVVFSANGTRSFTYTGQVSAPQGNTADWLEFTPYSSLPGQEARLVLSLNCRGNEPLDVELLQNGTPLQGWGSLECGQAYQPLLLPTGTAYILHVWASSSGPLVLVQYTVSVENEP
jgi:uncharacterized protein YraI